MKHIIYTLTFLIIAGVGFGAMFYNNYDAEASDEAVSEAPQAMPVKITVMKPRHIQVWGNFSGHVVAVNRAEIRPQVSGRITEIHFTDGQHVEKGDVLFVIDPRPYEAALNQAKATLAATQTQAGLAEKEYQRAIKLIKTEAISHSVMDERTNNRQAANAAVQGAQAAVESAQINLDYAHVKAPISGKTSRAEITEGNLVQTGPNAPLLTSIVAQDRVYVDFEVDESTYINSAKTGSFKKDQKTPVRLQLLDGDLEYKGFVHSFDNRIDATSGTIRARAIFDNEDNMLLPGMSVSILMGSADNEEHLLISERAISTDQDRKFVYIVNDDNIATYRAIKIGNSINGERVVLSGLNAGDKVITEGIVHIRPGALVSAQASDTTPKNVAPDTSEKED